MTDLRKFAEGLSREERKELIGILEELEAKELNDRAKTLWENVETHLTELKDLKDKLSKETRKEMEELLSILMPSKPNAVKEKKPTLTDTQKTKIIRLSNEGETIKDIAQKVGCSPASVSNVRKDKKWRKPDEDTKKPA